MTVFTDNQETSDTQQQESSFVEPTSSSALNDLVGEGRKFNDVEALARGKQEADNFIEQMKRENAELKADLERQSYALGVAQKMGETASASTAEPSNSEQTGGTSEGANTKPTTSEANIESLVEKTLQKREQDTLSKQNLATVENELAKVYGTEATNAVNQKASELNLPLKDLQAMAEKSPNAFMQLMGQQPPVQSPMVQGSIRTEGSAMQTSAERDWSYYQKLRRENQSQYYTPKIQRQLMEDKKRLGDRFGN
jgi:hypothetical protein